jgi:hypothetical protein
MQKSAWIPKFQGSPPIRRWVFRSETGTESM